LGPGLLAVTGEAVGHQRPAFTVRHVDRQAMAAGTADALVGEMLCVAEVRFQGLRHLPGDVEEGMAVTAAGEWALGGPG
jgi:hypothetical protein